MSTNQESVSTWAPFSALASTSDPTKIVATSTGRLLSIIFQELAVNLESDVLAGTAFASGMAQAAVPETEEFVGYSNNLRIWLAKDPDARICIQVDAGGHAEMFEYPYGMDIPGSTAQEVIKSFLSYEPRFPVETNIPRAPLPPYSFAISVTVQSRSATAVAEVQIESLDVRAIFALPEND